MHPNDPSLAPSFEVDATSDSRFRISLWRVLGKGRISPSRGRRDRGYVLDLWSLSRTAGSNVGELGIFSAPMLIRPGAGPKVMVTHARTDQRVAASRQSGAAR